MQLLKQIPKQAIQPPLKWAGGKLRLLGYIHQVLPSNTRLIEPFVGAGAVFANIDYPRYWLNDINADLILFYKMLKKHGSEFIDYLRPYCSPNYNTKKRFYALREKFNQSEANMEKAALFFYLNRHSYNGLCRYNNSGQFNAPFGQYKKIFFPEASLLLFHKKLKRSKLTCWSFERVMRAAQDNDILYCDPPYLPLSDSAYFTKYYTSTFGHQQQRLLADLAQQLQKRNITTVISNHDTELARQLYHKATLHSFPARRTISCQANGRKAVKELLACY